MAEDFIKVLDRVTKLLGKDAKIPEAPFDIHKTMAPLNESKDALAARSTSLRKALVQAQNKYLVAINDLEDYRKQVVGSDFGLDTRDKEAAKKIADVNKSFENYFAKKISSLKKGAKDIDGLIDKLP